MINIIIMGFAGSGKGTQSTFISEKYKIPEISTGVLLRKKANDGDELGLKIKNKISSGDVVDDDIVFDLLKDRINMDDCSNGFILDGFPRSINQAIELDKYLGEQNQINFVLVLDVPRDIVFKRITGRFECKKCCKIYNKFFNNTSLDGICDSCGSNDFFIRDDDKNLEAINKRLDIYENMSKVIIDYYNKKNLIYFIDGLKDIKEISEDIENILINNINKK